ncbi:MAG: hypothetical protein DWQ37_17650 [Planctomycetota bacterium]|nr:MAG: hypothetical protein DWQ37_17650 [Planctomycetota bacterium]
MNQQKRFYRKIVYACIIVALLLPLSWLSQPQTTDSDGGQLAQMRERYQLGQAQLGEIDPASETIRLATLGMRNIAANLLWEKANEYRKTEDWVNLSATLEQIARLQPNFVSVWVFQGWNLSYNISVEFDDYHDRYYWVIKGIDFLKEGTTYNKDEPRLLGKIGFTIAQKIGRADEHVQFREMFVEDDDFHGSVPVSQRDNWLVGRQWMLKAEEAVARGVPLRGQSPLLFYSHPVMCLINYAEAIESEGTFGEVAKNAWRQAAENWAEFSNHDFPTKYNVFARLNEKEDYEEKSKQAQAKLEELAPGLREQIREERIAALSEEERDAYNTSPESRTSKQQQMMFPISLKIEVTHRDVADRVEGEDRAAALQAAEEATFADEMARAIDIDRGIVNYDYWKLRCEVEQQDDALAARKLVYDADQAFADAEITQAASLYEEGFDKWRNVLDAYPKLLDDAATSDELIESIDHYRRVLHQLDREFPKEFVLQNVLDADDLYRGTGQRQSTNNKTEAESADPTQSNPAGAAPEGAAAGGENPEA